MKPSDKHYYFVDLLHNILQKRAQIPSNHFTGDRTDSSQIFRHTPNSSPNSNPSPPEFVPQ